MGQVAPSRYHPKQQILLISGLARSLLKGFLVRGLAADRKPKMSHLDNIATRQRKSLVRDALFASFVALAAIVSISTVSKVASASSAVVHR